MENVGFPFPAPRAGPGSTQRVGKHSRLGRRRLARQPQRVPPLRVSDAEQRASHVLCRSLGRGPESSSWCILARDTLRGWLCSPFPSALVRATASRSFFWFWGGSCGLRHRGLTRLCPLVFHRSLCRAGFIKFWGGFFGEAIWAGVVSPGRHSAHEWQVAWHLERPQGRPQLASLCQAGRAPRGLPYAGPSQPGAPLCLWGALRPERASGPSQPRRARRVCVASAGCARALPASLTVPGPRGPVWCHTCWRSRRRQEERVPERPGAIRSYGVWATETSFSTSPYWLCSLLNPRTALWTHE